MKYGQFSTYKDNRRWGRHHSGGHPPGQQKTGGQKTWVRGPGKPSTRRYFDECRWIENKRRRIARARRACR